MSELPTQEQARQFAHVIELGYMELGIRPSAADIGVPQVLNAYADGKLVCDSTLQDIAEAWNSDDNKELYDAHREDMRIEWPELADLLDALEGTDE